MAQQKENDLLEKMVNVFQSKEGTMLWLIKLNWHEVNKTDFGGY